MKANFRGGVKFSSQYFKHRFCRFFPWVITAYISLWVFRRIIIFPIASVGEGIDLFVEDLDELALISMGGSVDGWLFHRNTWTISAMLITEFIMWWLLSHHKRAFSEIITPLSIIVGLGIQAHSYAPDVESWIGFTTTSLLRTWIVYCAGWECYTLTKKLKALKLKRCGVFLLSATEVIGYACALLIMLNKDSRSYQWAITFIFVFIVAISMSGQTVLEKILSKTGFVRKICGFLGSMSLCIYLMQDSFISYMWYLWRDNEVRYAHKWILIIGLLGLALVQLVIVKLLVKFTRKIKTSLTRHIIDPLESHIERRN